VTTKLNSKTKKVPSSTPGQGIPHSRRRAETGGHEEFARMFKTKYFQKCSVFSKK